METVLLILIGAVLALALVWARFRFAGFAAQKPSDYAGQGPVLDIRKELDGPLQCEGVIYGPTGRVASRFVARMEAQWDGDTATMTESFTYDNGNTQERKWNFILGKDGSIKATAPDLVGEGTGKQEGPAVQLNYTIILAESAGGHKLSVTDWMYLCENGAIINRSQFRKFGIKVAELVATMRKIP